MREKFDELEVVLPGVAWWLEPWDYFYVNTEQKDVKAEDLVGKPKGMRQLLFERGCLESPTAKLTRPEAAKLMGNMPDYVAEENKFTRDIRCRGHLAIMSPIDSKKIKP